MSTLTILGIVLAAAVGLALLLVLPSIAVWIAMTRRPPRRPADIEARLLASGTLMPEWLAWPWFEARIPSHDGLSLALHGLEGSNGRLVLIHHGIGWNWHAGLEYAAFFKEAGYSLVLLDARRHGDSGGAATTFGVLESRDLGPVLAWAKARFPAEGGIALLGVSLGAATVLQYAPQDPGVGAIVADCPFSSAAAELDHLLARSRLPAFLRAAMLATVDCLCRRIDSFSLREASPAQACLRAGPPILFIHGLDDDYVPHAMSESMASRRREALPDARTELLLVPGAIHAKAHSVLGASYEGSVLAFVDSALGQGGKAGGGAD
jgi:uncharacterized protein